MSLEFHRIAPERAGIAPLALLSFVKTLDDLGLYTHSLLIARGNDLVYEAYYKPYERNTLHRQYSVSKSFVAAAVGMALTEGLISLDDVIIDYFPEFLDENTNDGLYTRCRRSTVQTIRLFSRPDFDLIGRVRSKTCNSLGRTRSRRSGELSPR